MLKFFTPLLIVVINSCCQNNAPHVKVRIEPDSIINVMQAGIGASIHAIEDSLTVSTDNNKYRSWGGSAWGGNPMPGDTARWNQVFRHCDWLGLDFCRVEIDHKMYEPQKGVLDTSNREMKILFTWLDYCQSRNIDVLLQEMWPNVDWLTYPEMLKDPVKKLRSAPNDLNAWGQGFARLLEYLYHHRNYTCIKYLSVANEPHQSWSWWQLPDGSSQRIEPALKILKELLEDKKVPVKLAGPDIWYNCNEVPLPCQPYVGAYSVHDYGAIFDWWENVYISWPMSPISNAEKNIRCLKQKAREDGNKPFLIAEHGTMMFGYEASAKGPGHYLSLLKDVQYVIRMSNAGVDGFNRWSLINRGDLDGQWQMIETWDPKKFRLLDTIAPKANAYYMYGLLTRFIPKYAEVLYTQVTGGADTLQRVFAATFRNQTDKNISICITNDSEVEYQLDCKLPAGQTFYRYQVLYSHKDKNIVEISPLEAHSSSASVVLPGRSLMVLSTYQLYMGDKGIVQ